MNGRVSALEQQIVLLRSKSERNEKSIAMLSGIIGEIKSSFYCVDDLSGYFTSGEDTFISRGLMPLPIAVRLDRINEYIIRLAGQVEAVADTFDTLQGNLSTLTDAIIADDNLLHLTIIDLESNFGTTGSLKSPQTLDQQLSRAQKKLKSVGEIADIVGQVVEFLPIPYANQVSQLLRAAGTLTKKVGTGTKYARHVASIFQWLYRTVGEVLQLTKHADVTNNNAVGSDTSNDLRQTLIEASLEAIHRVNEIRYKEAEDAGYPSSVDGPTWHYYVTPLLNTRLSQYVVNKLQGVESSVLRPEMLPESNTIIAHAFVIFVYELTEVKRQRLILSTGRHFNEQIIGTLLEGQTFRTNQIEISFVQEDKVGGVWEDKLSDWYIDGKAKEIANGPSHVPIGMIKGFMDIMQIEVPPYNLLDNNCQVHAKMAIEYAYRQTKPAWWTSRHSGTLLSSYRLFQVTYGSGLRDITTEPYSGAGFSGWVNANLKTTSITSHNWMRNPANAHLTSAAQLGNEGLQPAFITYHSKDIPIASRNRSYTDWMFEAL